MGKIFFYEKENSGMNDEQRERLSRLNNMLDEEADRRADIRIVGFGFGVVLTAVASRFFKYVKKKVRQRCDNDD